MSAVLPMAPEYFDATSGRTPITASASALPASSTDRPSSQMTS